MAPFLEDMDHIDEAEEYEKGVGITKTNKKAESILRFLFFIEIVQ